MAEPPAFDAQAYRGRNAVERLVGWLKETRAVATRSDKLAESFLGMVQMAMVRVCLRRAVPSNTA
jgi:transposase